MAQPVEAGGLNPPQYGFESHWGHPWPPPYSHPNVAVAPQPSVATATFGSVWRGLWRSAVEGGYDGGADLFVGAFGVEQQPFQAGHQGGADDGGGFDVGYGGFIAVANQVVDER